MPAISWPTIENGLRWLQQQQLLSPRQVANLQQTASAQAGAAAAVLGQSLQDRINDALSESFAAGEGYRDWQKRIKAIVAITSHEAEAIGRTYTHRAYHQGYKEIVEKPAIKDEFPYLLWLGTGDSRQRDDGTGRPSAKNHVALNDKVAHQGSPLAKIMEERIGDYNCRCSVVYISAEEARERGIDDNTGWVEPSEAETVPEIELPAEPKPFTIESFIPADDDFVMELDETEPTVEPDAPVVRAPEASISQEVVVRGNVVEVAANPSPAQVGNYLQAVKGYLRGFVQGDKVYVFDGDYQHDEVFNKMFGYKVKHLEKFVVTGGRDNMRVTWTGLGDFDVKEMPPALKAWGEQFGVDLGGEFRRTREPQAESPLSPDEQLERFSQQLLEISGDPTRKAEREAILNKAVELRKQQTVTQKPFTREAFVPQERPPQEQARIEVIQQNESALQNAILATARTIEQPGGRIFISELRRLMPELTKAEFDAMLLKMERDKRIALYALQDVPSRAPPGVMEGGLRNPVGDSREMLYIPRS